MNTFSEYMGDDHARCDQLFANAEAAVESGNWQQASAASDIFLEAIKHHLAMEEELLFPAFEQASGSEMGPTQVMRLEHEQMRGLFNEMGEAVTNQDAEAYLGTAETLLILMQQHNAKEEQILYPMSDRLLQGEQRELLDKMQAL